VTCSLKEEEYKGEGHLEIELLTLHTVIPVNAFTKVFIYIKSYFIVPSDEIGE
jgi:hypothetical protein